MAYAVRVPAWLPAARAVTLALMAVVAAQCAPALGRRRQRHARGRAPF